MLHFFNNLKYQKKFFIICLMISLVPTMILGIFCYSQIRTLLIERERTALRDSIVLESQNVSSRLKTYENVAEYIIWDSTILEVLNQKHDTNSQMYISYNKKLIPIYSTLKYMYPSIDEITIYSDQNIYPKETILEPINRIDKFSWYQEVRSSANPLWVYSSEAETLSVMNRFYDIPRDQTAIISLTLNYEEIFSTLTSLFNQSYGILLADDDGDPIWQFLSDDMQDQTMTIEQLLNTSLTNNDSENYIIETAVVPNNNWTFYLYRPLLTVTEPTQVITSTVMTIIFLCLLFVILLSYWLSIVLVRPLKKMTANMQQVAQGNYEINITHQSSDELGQLIESFKIMIEQLNHLINETLKAKILRQKLEFRALQAQINPHFLYNALSLINSKAILTGQQEISQVIQYLSTFYRTSLNKGNDLTSVGDELENVHSYINIQLAMHSNSFDVIYNIDKDILSFTMPNLMLQPLVENAISHGIDCNETPVRGLLEISAYSSEDTLIFRIKDNGHGIPESELSQILTHNSKGYGVQNVHARAQLQYGNQFGLCYHSQIGAGAEVSLTIPKQLLPEPPLTL